MRKLLLSIICILSSLVSLAQSYNERIAAAMNTNDWFALDSIYRIAPKDSVMPFLEVFSRCLIGNRLNRPEVSVKAFDELFKHHSASLGLSNLLSSTIMFATDLSRSGYNKEAAELCSTILNATGEHLDSIWTESLEQSASKYSALSAYRPYGVSFEETVGRIPFKIVPVEEKHGSVLMHLEDSYINGYSADITFDTGAGVNMISDSLARKFNLISIDGYVTVAGVGRRKGQYAIAEKIQIGNISVSDVPFVIMDLKTGNTEADQHTHHFSAILGSELMLHLKDLTVDFIKREITVPSVAPEKSVCAPNMCFGEGMTLNCIGRVLDKPVLMNIDTGDAAYGTLGVSFFNDYKDYIMAYAEADSIRRAGLGGVIVSRCYRINNIPVSLGGKTIETPGLVVETEPSSAAMRFDCNLGLKALMRFDKIRFNLVDFVLTTYPQEQVFLNNSVYSIPSFRLTNEKKPSNLQTLGIISLGVTKALLYPDAPASPDL